MGDKLSEQEERDIEETRYLLSIPGMEEKILQGLAIPLSECVEDDSV